MIAARNERRLRFAYGECGDEGELVIRPVAASATAAPLLSMVALPGAWQLIAARPTTLAGKQMLRAAEAASGLKLAFRAAPWVGRGRSSRARRRAGR